MEENKKTEDLVEEVSEETVETAETVEEVEVIDENEKKIAEEQVVRLWNLGKVVRTEIGE